MFNDLIESLEKIENAEIEESSMFEHISGESYRAKALSISEGVSEEDIMAGDVEITSPEEEKRLMKLIDLIPDDSEGVKRQIDDVVESIIPVDIMAHNIPDHLVSESVMSEFELD